MLVEKGYKKETGFALLSKLRTTFLEMFTADKIERAKPYSLTKEFKNEAKSIVVSWNLSRFKCKELFSVDSYDKTEEAINALGQAKDATTRNLQKLLERDDKFDNLLNKADQMG